MKSRHANLQRLGLLGAALCVFGLAGCSDRLGDLRQYANDVKARKGGHIEPLPQIKPFETYTYADQDQRSPFVPQLESNFGNASALKGMSTTGLHPDFNRAHEYLEQFPLDGLKMMGTLTVNGTLYGLVKDSDNILHRVTVGNYMGQNYGKIVSITDSDIKLREIVPDGQGGWSERVTDVALSE
ncbi:MAG TPA: pilus assembly protein PilP [Gammaproteobacteria bacterium]|nr:pilus assembly protein PilP [Gammaproteobacteria bacterium]